MNNFKQANIERFNDIAAGWDQDSGRTAMASAIAQTMLGMLAPQGTEQALEFGCGTGLLTLQLAPRVKRITAVDSSLGMLNELRRKISNQAVTNVEAVEGDVSDVLPHQRFDLILSSMTLHHVEDVGSLFHTLFAKLNRGGRVALADLDAEDGSFHGDKPGIAHHGFARQTIKRWLTAAGFSDIGFVTAYTVHKEDAHGKAHEYPVFLVVANKCESPAPL